MNGKGPRSKQGPKHGCVNGPSDEKLMSAYRSGDSEAFKNLFERYAPRLYTMFRRGGLDPEDARELVQQTFLQLHRARDDYRETMPFRPWIITIARNLRRAHYRKRMRAGRSGFGLALPAMVDGQVPLTIRRVRLALDRLPPSLREVIVLHWFIGLGYREIAERLGDATELAVKLRAHRGYVKLRAMLGE